MDENRKVIVPARKHSASASEGIPRRSIRLSSSVTNNKSIFKGTSQDLILSASEQSPAKPQAASRRLHNQLQVAATTPSPPRQDHVANLMDADVESALLQDFASFTLVPNRIVSSPERGLLLAPTASKVDGNSAVLGSLSPDTAHGSKKGPKAKTLRIVPKASPEVLADLPDHRDATASASNDHPTEAKLPQAPEWFQAIYTENKKYVTSLIETNNTNLQILLDIKNQTQFFDKLPLLHKNAVNSAIGLREVRKKAMEECKKAMEECEQRIVAQLNETRAKLLATIADGDYTTLRSNINFYYSNLPLDTKRLELSNVRKGHFMGTAHDMRFKSLDLDRVDLKQFVQREVCPHLSPSQFEGLLEDQISFLELIQNSLMAYNTLSNVPAVQKDNCVHPIFSQFMQGLLKKVGSSLAVFDSRQVRLEGVLDMAQKDATSPHYVYFTGFADGGIAEENLPQFTSKDKRDLANKNDSIRQRRILLGVASESDRNSNGSETSAHRIKSYHVVKTSKILSFQNLGDFSSMPSVEAALGQCFGEVLTTASMRDVYRVDGCSTAEQLQHNTVVACVSDLFTIVFIVYYKDPATNEVVWFVTDCVDTADKFVLILLLLAAPVSDRFINLLKRMEKTEGSARTDVGESMSVLSGSSDSDFDSERVRMKQKQLWNLHPPPLIPPPANTRCSRSEAPGTQSTIRTTVGNAPNDAERRAQKDAMTTPLADSLK